MRTGGFISKFTAQMNEEDGNFLKINKQGGRNFWEVGKFLKNNKQGP